MLDAAFHRPPLPASRAAKLPIMAMARFRRLMLREGWPVDLPRLCVDRHYTFGCLALAHTSSDPDLHRAARGLFAAYESGGLSCAVLH